MWYKDLHILSISIVSSICLFPRFLCLQFSKFFPSNPWPINQAIWLWIYEYILTLGHLSIHAKWITRYTVQSSDYWEDVIFWYLSRAEVGSHTILACIHILRWTFNKPSLTNFFFPKQYGNTYTTIVASWGRETSEIVFDDVRTWATCSYCLLVPCSTSLDWSLMCYFHRMMVSYGAKLSLGTR